MKIPKFLWYSIWVNVLSCSFIFTSFATNSSSSVNRSYRGTQTPSVVEYGNINKIIGASTPHASLPYSFIAELEKSLSIKVSTIATSTVPASVNDNYVPYFGTQTQGELDLKKKDDEGLNFQAY